MPGSEKRMKAFCSTPQSKPAALGLSKSGSGVFNSLYADDQITAQRLTGMMKSAANVWACIPLLQGIVVGCDAYKPWMHQPMLLVVEQTSGETFPSTVIARTGRQTERKSVVASSDVRLVFEEDGMLKYPD